MTLSASPPLTMAKDPGALSVGATNSLTSPQRTTVCAPAALMPMATATTDRASPIRRTRFMLVRDAGPVPSWAPTDRTPANDLSVAVVRAVKGSHARPLSSAPRAIALGLALGAIGTFATVVGPGLVVAALVALLVMLAPQRAAVGGGVLLGFGLGWAYLIADAAA